MTSRRSFLLGLGAALAAPAIVRAEMLMPVRRIIAPTLPDALLPALEPLLPCDGREISRAVYAGLFNVLGERYGAGDGISTFNIPDYRPQLAVEFPDSDLLKRPVLKWPLDTRITTVEDPAGLCPVGTISTYAPHPNVDLDDPRIEGAWWRE